MTIKRSRVIWVALFGAISLSGCIGLYEGTDSVCPHGDPNADNWPYCGSVRPGGNEPGYDVRTDPRAPSD